jgi:protein SHQ1
MITPQFSLDQTDSHLIIRVQVPHIRVSVQSVEVVITDGSVVHFCSPPYLLRLNFASALSSSSSVQGEGEGCPPAFADDAEDDCAEYDPSTNGTLVLRLQKRVPAPWDGLHLIGRFVASTTAAASSPTSRWLQEIVAEENGGSDLPVGDEKEVRGANDEGNPASETAESTHESVHPSPLRLSDGTAATGYGFAHMFRDVLHHDWSKDGMAKEMLEGWSHFWCDWPTRGDESDHELRQRLHTTRRQVENDAFSSDRYLQDTDVEDDYIYQCAMSFDPHWTTSFVGFTDEERQELACTPYPLLPPVVLTGDDRTTMRLLLGAADILFAYVYDHLTTCGDPTVESAWTIVILSPSLSWLDDGWTGVDDDDDDDAGVSDEGEQSMIQIKRVIRSSLRRSLVYPYLRNLDLAVRCANHVAKILAGGNETMIRCLLQARTVLNRSDLYYLSNKLYLDPYLAWLQSVDVSRCIASLSARLSEQIEACVLSHDWRAEIKLPVIHLEDPASESEASDDGSVDVASTSSSETGDWSADSGTDDDIESNVKANPNDAYESPSLRTDCKQTPDVSEAILPALEDLSLNDNAHREMVLQTQGSHGTPCQRRRVPLIQELD